MKKVNFKSKFEGLLPEWDGCIVDCFINDIEIKGEITLEDDGFYILQNETDGYSCNDKKDYMYSWYVDDGSIQRLNSNNVYINNIYLEDRILVISKVEPICILGYRVKFEESIFLNNEISGITVGCTFVSYETVKKIYNRVRSIERKQKNN